MVVSVTYIIKNLPSLSTMVTVTSLGLFTFTWLGSVTEVILSWKVSLLSNILSSIIFKFNATSVSPAGNVTLYGPEL